MEVLSARFERISVCPNAILPIRKTEEAAGYDFFISEDIVIPSHLSKLIEFLPGDNESMTLEQVAAFTKAHGLKPTLVPTGVKAYLEPDTYLELTVRSSCPLKYLLLLANGVGVIDRDYYNNEDNEGAIYFQLLNLFPYPIKLQKGECIGQGIIKPFLKTADDAATGIRTGGFGSTDGSTTTGT